MKDFCNSPGLLWNTPNFNTKEAFFSDKACCKVVYVLIVKKIVNKVF